MRVFLSGDTRTEWHDQVKKRFEGHEFFDPRTLSDLAFPEMAATERAWIDKSDIVFAYLSGSNPYGFGTCFEVGYAVAHKKVIVYVDEKQVSSSRWIAAHPVHAATDLESGLEILQDLLTQGADLVATQVVNGLRAQDFTVLVVRELQDDVVSRVADAIRLDHALYTPLMLASQMLPKTWYDWNLGYLLQQLDPVVIAANLTRYGEHCYKSEGIAWALGLLGNDDERIVQFLQQQCRRCEDYDAWWCAAHSLEQLGRGDAVDILKRTLVQPEWQDVQHCLEQIGSRAATIGLLRKVNRGNIDEIVRRCLEALGTLSGRRLHNVIWLLERLRQRTEPVVKALTNLHEARVLYGSSAAHRVVEALGQLAHPSSRKLLEQDLLDAEYFRTRAWAAKGLGLIGDHLSLTCLSAALAKEKNPHVLATISTAIYAIRDDEKRRDNEMVSESQWLENGMIIDESNKWYWAPEEYDKFSRAEDPESVAFGLALDLFPQSATRVLDLGSGTGRFVDEINRHRAGINAIWAVDNSDDMVEFLKRKFRRNTPKVEVIGATLESIPLPDSSVDVAVSSWGFPSRVWNSEQSMRELTEVHRLLRPDGKLITIGWDEDFSDEMTEVWYRFVMEEECYFDSLPEYRRRRRARLSSARNCHLTMVKTRVRVPVKFQTRREAAHVFGHLFGYGAGVWVLESGKREFQMHVGITENDRNSIGDIIATYKGSDGAPLGQS